ncbi:MAG TPA: molybdate ABC transporter substrate-binding protein [Polyangiaceae bacterium]
MKRAASATAVLLFVFGLAVAGCKKEPPPPKKPLKVAAAADLSHAFTDVAEAYRTKTGQEVKLSFGATGLLEKQIAEGAPFDVFAAANVSFVDDAVKAGACFADTKSTYAFGHLVVWAKKGSPVPAQLADLADPAYAKIAIANPDHAPYGKAAKQALERAGVWDKVSSRIVYGENVQQTLAFAESGNAEVALVALSLAIGGEGVYAEIGGHDPLEQSLVVCKGEGQDASPDGKAFAAFVASPEGRAIMRRYGFLLPGETIGDAGK